MKKFICILFLCATSLTGFAQGKGKLEFGVNTGLNFSSLSTNYGNTDVSTSFNVGASADYFFSDAWSLKVKAIYDRKGWDNDYFPDTNIPTDINADYITVPVTAGYHFGRTNNWYINFGLYAGFLLNAETTADNGDITNEFEKNDFGLDYGIGVKIPISPKLKLFFEYEGQSGFIDALRYSRYDNVNTRSALNVGFNFLMN